MTPQDRVDSALRLLCYRAGVAPDDGGAWAAQLVVDRLALEGVSGVPSCPTDCPLSNWLKRATGYDAHPRDPSAVVVLMGPEQVNVLLPRVNGRRPAPDPVPLPAAVRAAVALIGERRPKQLTTEAA